MNYRNELKYMLTNVDVAILKGRLNSILIKDPNVKGNSYNVKSLYFDDRYLSSYYQVVNSLNERWKWRIRFYNDDDTYICLEKKNKVNGKVFKEKCQLTKEDVLDILDNKKIKMSDQKNKLLNEFYYNILVKGLKPIIIISYDRIPYIYKVSDIRITLDYNLSVSDKVNELFNKKINMIPLMEIGNVLLEVKYNQFLPDYIMNKFNLCYLERTSYSKYLQGMLFLKKKYN